MLFPQEASQNNLRAILRARERLDAGDVSGALEAIYEIDNNRYAFQFEEEVFLYFTEYVLAQPGERLQWGKGRILHHENLFALVRSLIRKVREAGIEKRCLTEEIQLLAQTAARQERCLRDDIAYITEAVRKLEAIIRPLAGRETARRPDCCE